MANCKKCGCPLDDESKEYCEKCAGEMNTSSKKNDITMGASPTMSKSAVDSSKMSESVSNNTPVVQVKAENEGLDKKKKTIVAVVAIVLVIIVLIVVIVLALKSRSSKPDDSKNGTRVEIVSNEFGVPLTDENGENVTRIVKDGEKADSEIVTNELGQKISDEQIKALQEATTKTSSNVGTESDNKIEVVEENAPDNGAAQNNNSQGSGNNSGGGQGNNSGSTKKPVTVKANDKELKLINDFLGGTYYIDGVLYAEGEGTSTIMSVNGDDYEILANIDGTEISICRYGDKFYMKRPASKQYCELNDKMLDMMGMTKEDITIPTEAYKVGDGKPSSVIKVKINGKDGTCYTYKTVDKCDVKFYFVGGKFVQIETYSTAGEKETEIKINEFSGELPSDQMNLKGYKSAPLGDMLADVLAAEQ